MAGPRGGGGFGGGSFGGSGGGGGGFGGGSFGGGGHHHHHHYGPRFGGWWFFGPRRYYGGGCLGAILAPVIIMAFLVIFLILMLSSTITSIANGGSIVYDEVKFQDYANERYYELYGSSSNTAEDNVLIVFLTSEEHDGYYAIVWMGDNLTDEVAYEFSGNYSYFEDLMVDTVPDQHKYSLSANLATVMRKMTARIASIDEKFYIDNGAHDPESSRLVNDSTLEMNEATVETEIDNFYAATGIPLSIVIDDTIDVFGKGFDVFEIIIIVLLIAGIVALIVVIVKRAKESKKQQNSKGRPGDRDGDGIPDDYDDFDSSGYN
ncbi:MAG: hypothetical protein IKC87_01050 [Clostridia bacterium]|nr:hypothetical protein [Clostridia bacterium]